MAYQITSESVGEGHPDKVADLISDSILDACLKDDANSRVACETLVKNDRVILAGEITTNSKFEYNEVVRDAIHSVGYYGKKQGGEFNWCDVKIDNYITTQSPDIAQGVNAATAEGKTGDEQGAGDQGIMFGYATDETEEMLPAPLVYAHKLMRKLADARHNHEREWLLPDSKSQVTVLYDCNGKIVGISNVVLSTQHTDYVSINEVREYCTEFIKLNLPEHLINERTKFHINPTGRFVIGGPVADCGLTGRKIIVDTYGGVGHHGGGAFSGKDPSKVDRSGAYMARWIAKHIVRAGLAHKCEVQIAYAIGEAHPVAINANLFGTSQLTNQEIERRIQCVFRMKPADIIEELNLKRPIYASTTNYGHFGKSNLPWEQINRDIVKKLQDF